MFSIGWLLATGLLALYVANFANYSNTYGALGGVIVLMLWFYLSALILVAAAALVAAALKELHPVTVAEGHRAAEERSSSVEPAGAPATDGRHAYLPAADGSVRIIDTGAWKVDHGDHVQIICTHDPTQLARSHTERTTVRQWSPGTGG